MVTNLLDAGPTNGATTVREIVPEGLSLRTIGGTGWNCGLETCTRNDALPGGASYPPITVMVGIDPRASCQVLNQATVFGGGSVAAGGGDLTNVTLSGELGRAPYTGCYSASQGELLEYK